MRHAHSPRMTQITIAIGRGTHVNGCLAPWVVECQAWERRCLDELARSMSESPVRSIRISCAAPCAIYVVFGQCFTLESRTETTSTATATCRLLTRHILEYGHIDRHIGIDTLGEPPWTSVATRQSSTRTSRGPRLGGNESRDIDPRGQARRSIPTPFDLRPATAPQSVPPHRRIVLATTSGKPLRTSPDLTTELNQHVQCRIRTTRSCARTWRARFCVRCQ